MLFIPPAVSRARNKAKEIALKEEITRLKNRCKQAKGDLLVTELARASLSYFRKELIQLKATAQL